MKKSLLLFCLCIAYYSNAQTGINTYNPQGILHVDGAKDNNASGVPTTLQQANDLIVTSAGNVGIGTTTPTTKLEVMGDAKIQGLLPYFSASSTDGAPSFMLPLNLLAPSTKLKITFAFETNNAAGNSQVYYNTGSGWVLIGYTGPCGGPSTFFYSNYTITRPVSSTGTISILVANNSVPGCQSQAFYRSTVAIQAVD